MKGTTDVGIVYDRNINTGSVLGYVDSDFADDLDKRRSLTDYDFTFSSGAINWKAVLRFTTPLSTTEAEYMVATEAVKEAIWLRSLVDNLGLHQKLIVVFYDG